HAALSRALGKTWEAERVDHHSACWGKPESHRDDDYWGLLQTARLFHAAAPGYPAHRLLGFSPHSPAAHARLIETDWQFASQHADEWQRDFAESPLVMRAFAQHYAKAGDAEATQRCLSAYLKRSPDLWAYRQLAKSYLQQNDRENWKATLDEFLTQEDYGLEHARVRVEIANYFMDQQEWEQAQPYAEEAAETWAEWAMLCAVRCYRGLVNEEQEGAWLGRLLERYTSRNHAVNYFYWCHRTGLGDADVAMQILEPFLAAEQGGGSGAGSQFIYLAANRRREALKAFQSQIKKDGIEPSTGRFYASYIALLAWELGETEAANDALKLLSAEANNFALVFNLYKKFRDAGEGAKFDVDEARSIIKDLSGLGRLNVSFFAARLMELAGQKQDAVEFYRIAATTPDTQLHVNHCMARQALRRLGAEIKGDDLKQAAKGG
ncbi:MAG TPA: hypothetical protein VHC19_07535, partial [Pirellulales bacterium]|nr:hypothetical protein [Pirellulales bacterium]